jgi:hypothetical protein
VPNPKTKPPKPAHEPDPTHDRPQVREEYPGPQTASTGEHIEPGQVTPTTPKRRKGWKA